MGFASRYETSVSHFQYNPPYEIPYTYLSAAIPILGNKLTAGAVFGYFNPPDIEITTIMQPEGTGEKTNSYEYQLGGAVAYRPIESLSVGLTVKRVYQEMYSNISISGVAMDIGAQYRYEFDRHQLSASFAALNFGPDLKTRGPDLIFESQSENDIPGYENFSDQYTDIDRTERWAYVQTHQYELPGSYSVGLAYSFSLLETGAVTVAYEFLDPSGYGEKNFHSAGDGIKYAAQRIFFCGGAYRLEKPAGRFFRV